MNAFVECSKKHSRRLFLSLLGRSQHNSGLGGAPFANPVAAVPQRDSS